MTTRRATLPLLWTAVVVPSCTPAAPPDAAVPVAWGRPHFQTGGGDALLWFVVLGDFPADPYVAAEDYRITGKLEELSQQRHLRGAAIDQMLGNLKVLVPDTSMMPKALAAPQRVEIRATARDPADLVYLRNAVGMVTWLMDHGGIAVVDLQSWAIFDRENWRERMFADDAPRPRAHVSILVSDEPAEGTTDKQLWFHTRGMRKFGRPDISISHVPEQQQPKAIGLIERFIVVMAQGAQPPEGRAIRMQDIPEGMSVHHAGSLDDPEFNNVHFELRWPAGGGK